MNLHDLLKKFDIKRVCDGKNIQALIPRIYEAVGEEYNGWILSDVFERKETERCQHSYLLLQNGFYTALHFLKKAKSEEEADNYFSAFEHMNFLQSKHKGLAPEFSKADYFLKTSLLHKALPALSKYVSSFFKKNTYYHETSFDTLSHFNKIFCEALFYINDLSMHLEVGLRVPKKHELLINLEHSFQK